MAIGLRRKVRLDSRRTNQKITRNKNSAHKRKERARRDARIIAQIKVSDGSYSPAISSWIADKLGKPASKATKEDIASLIG